MDTNVIVKEILARWRKKNYQYEALRNAIKRHKVGEIWTSTFVIAEVAGRLMEEYLLRKLYKTGYTFLDIKEKPEESLAKLFSTTYKNKSEILRSRYCSLIANKINDFLLSNKINHISLATEGSYWAGELLKDKTIRTIPDRTILEATPAYMVLMLEAWEYLVMLLSMIPIKLGDAIIIADASILVGPSRFLTTDIRLLDAKKEIKQALVEAYRQYPQFISREIIFSDANKFIRFQFSINF